MLDNDYQDFKNKDTFMTKSRIPVFPTKQDSNRSSKCGRRKESGLDNFRQGSMYQVIDPEMKLLKHCHFIN